MQNSCKILRTYQKGPLNNICCCQSPIALDFSKRSTMIMSELLYCGYCSTDIDTDTDAESEKHNSGESNDITKFQTSKLLPHLIKINQHPKQRRRSRAFMAFQTPKSSKQVSTYAWKENLLQISNVASFLCVIDCTILPIITLLLPLIGFAASPDQEEWLHHIGHKVAMNFVLPIGGMAVTMNYPSHKRISLLFVSILGLFLIFVANSSCHSPIVSIFPHHIGHLLHEGLVHRCVNTLGCALLTFVNYIGHKRVCDDKDFFSGLCCIGRRRGV